jgi:hypothetical protein
VFANRMLTAISGSRNEELRVLNIVRTVEFRRLREAGFEARVGSTQNFDGTVFLISVF